LIFKRIMRGLFAAISPQKAAAIGTTAVMIGLSLVYRAYGTEAFLVATAIVIVLSILLLRACPLPMAPISDRPDPLALPDDGLPPLSGPTAHAQIAAAKSRPALTTPPPGISPAASDPAGNVSHLPPAEHRW
jgi:hypothetical protein